MKLFRMTPDLRPKLAQPMGKLFPGPPAVSIPKVKEWLLHPSYARYTDDTSDPIYPLICVGDVVSQAFLNDRVLGPLVKYCFVDGGTQRGERVELAPEKYRKRVTFENPRGTINAEIFSFFRDTWEDDLTYIVEIKGEEDLLVIPAVISCEKALIAYGQPPVTDLAEKIPAGCVVIENSPDMVKRCRDLLDQFEAVEN